MGLFNSENSSIRYGALVDVGSASVLVTIVRSDISLTHPEIVWSRREFVPLKDFVSIDHTAKNVMTSLVTAVLALGNEGVTTLREVDPEARIKHLQVSVSAPWSYTITKSITYADGESFEVTPELIKDLTKSAQEKAEAQLQENEIVQKLGLQVIARTTTDLIVNGYRSREPFGEVAKEISLSHVSAVAQHSLVEAISDTQNKILPEAVVTKYSCMLIYFCILRELYPSAREFCVIDVTYEATEVGVIREGVLQFTTHVPVGSFTLARDISKALNVPIEEAFGYLKNENQEWMSTLNEKKKATLNEVFDSYVQQVNTLLHQTGDRLSIPRALFMHCGLRLEETFKKYIKKAAEQATHSDHTVHQVTSEMLTKHYDPEAKQALLKQVKDTSVLLSAQFFHKQHHCQDFEQL